MKTVKVTFLALSLFCLLGVVKAEKPKNRTVFTMKFSISSFIDADTRGLCNGLANIINDNAKFTMMRGDQLISCNKKQIVNYLEKLRGIQQNCTTSYDVIEAADKYALIKVVMKYPAFTRFNYVTMNECSDGWKITNVNSIFVK
ncbi:MAG: hypothetical protein EOP43_03555 [Sphingobacteriaceae bacterium]|nr:MAG: hypothetical protein EOP43_03555 [Sphingobacteriaceae bacterium]